MNNKLNTWISFPLIWNHSAFLLYSLQFRLCCAIGIWPRKGLGRRRVQCDQILAAYSLSSAVGSALSWSHWRWHYLTTTLVLLWCLGRSLLPSRTSSPFFSFIEVSQESLSVVARGKSLPHLQTMVWWKCTRQDVYRISYYYRDGCFCLNSRPNKVSHMKMMKMGSVLRLFLTS